MKELLNSAKILQKTAFLHVFHYLNTNREEWPNWIVATSMAAMALALSGVLIAITDPAVQEIFNNLAMTAMLYIVSICATAGALIIARGIYLSSIEVTADMPPALSLPEKIFLVFGVSVNWGSTPAELSAWAEPDCRPDILIATRPGESSESFASRLLAAVSKAGRSCWVVSLAKGQPMGMIYGSATEALYFDRTRPPFQTEEWPEEYRIVPANTRFVGETESDFREYVRKFMLHFPEWSAKKKISGDPSRAGFVFQEIVRAASVLLLCLIGTAAFAQKSAQVKATPIANLVASHGEVIFTFERAELYRTGDGKKTFSDLLKSVPGYRDGGGGSLIAITAGGKVVYKANQAGEVVTRASAMRPRSETIDPETVRGFDLPDSAESAEITERLRHNIRTANEVAQQVSRPWWELAMFAYWEWFWLTIIIAGPAWMLSNYFAREGWWRWHRAAKAVFSVIAAVSGVLFAVNIILLMKWAGANNGLLAGAAIVLFVGLYRLMVWIDPDFKPARGNDPRNSPNSNRDVPRITA